MTDISRTDKAPAMPSRESETYAVVGLVIDLKSDGQPSGWSRSLGRRAVSA